MTQTKYIKDIPLEEYNRQYYLAHKKQAKEYTTRWRVENRERKYEQNRNSNHRNKEKIRLKTRLPEKRYINAKSSAKRRNHRWTIQKDFYIKLISQSCFYCNGPISLTGIGLDRRNSRKGYEPFNVVPCCYRCNLMKNSELTVDEMLLIWKIRREKKCMNNKWRKKI